MTNQVFCNTFKIVYNREKTNLNSDSKKNDATIWANKGDFYVLQTQKRLCFMPAFGRISPR